MSEILKNQNFKQLRRRMIIFDIGNFIWLIQVTSRCLRHQDEVFWNTL